MILTMDPWQHRSQNMTCLKCMWFALKESKENTVQDLGRCRRHAPSMNGYPVVYVNDWCGDHKLDENKVEHGMLAVWKAMKVNQKEDNDDM